MKEGEALKGFLDTQAISKVQVAKDLGMTKQNLYQLFKSQFLEQETKEKFENYFKRSIFTHLDIDHIQPKDLNKKNSGEVPEFMQKYIEQLEKNNAILERQMLQMEQNQMQQKEEWEVRLRAVDKAFEQIEIMKGYLNRFEKSHQEIRASLNQVSDDQYFFATVQQAWQELWMEHIPTKPKLTPHEAKEKIRIAVSSNLAAANDKNKEVFYSEGN